MPQIKPDRRLITCSAASIAPAGVEICIPCTSGRMSARSRGRSESLPPRPGPRPRHGASARRRPAGTRTPGTSLAMNSACRRLSSGMMPAMIGMRTCRRSAAGTSANPSASNTGCVTANSAPASTLYSNRRISSSQIERAGFARHADVKRRRLADRLPADVEPAVQPRDHVGQADRIDVEDRRRVRVVADAWRVAGDEQHVADAHRVRAEQVRLHAEQVSVAARVVEDRLDAGLLLHDAATRPARSCARSRAGHPEC